MGRYLCQECKPVVQKPARWADSCARKSAPTLRLYQIKRKVNITFYYDLFNSRGLKKKFLKHELIIPLRNKKGVKPKKNKQSCYLLSFVAHPFPLGFSSVSAAWRYMEYCNLGWSPSKFLSPSPFSPLNILKIQRRLLQSHRFSNVALFNFLTYLITASNAKETTSAVIEILMSVVSRVFRAWSCFIDSFVGFSKMNSSVSCCLKNYFHLESQLFCCLPFNWSITNPSPDNIFAYFVNRRFSKFCLYIYKIICFF